MITVEGYKNEFRWGNNQHITEDRWMLLGWWLTDTRLSSSENTVEDERYQTYLIGEMFS